MVPERRGRSHDVGGASSNRTADPEKRSLHGGVAVRCGRHPGI